MLSGTFRFSSWGGDVSSCDSCGSTGSYSRSGATSCTPCGNGERRERWTGGPLKDQCVCIAGYTGDNCEFKDCNKLLGGLSMGAMLFMSDRTLRQYSLKFNASNFDQIKAAKHVVLTLLKTSVDINGDGNVTISEMQKALKYRSVWSDDMSHLPLWCSSASSPLSANCYKDENRNPSTVIETNRIYADAVFNYLDSSKHTFDGSGIPFMKSLLSSYPTASWNEDKCKSYNPTWDPTNYKRVDTTWDWTSNRPTITQVCGYSNGAFVPAFVTSGMLTGVETKFTDNVPVSPSNMFKRVYCISVVYAAKTSFECSVGLFYVSSVFLIVVLIS